LRHHADPNETNRRKEKRHGRNPADIPLELLDGLGKERAMKKLMEQVVEFLKREDGPTAVEYAVMLSLIIVVCIVAITALGTGASQTFNQVGTAITSS
jgi:pilus assembly protein Flp/PilA